MTYLFGQLTFLSGRPSLPYKLELIKEGVSKGAIPLHEKGWYLFGRIPICDVQLDHPVWISGFSTHNVSPSLANMLSSNIVKMETPFCMTWDPHMALSWEREDWNQRNTFQLYRETISSGKSLPFDLFLTKLRFGQSKRFYVLDGSIEKKEEEEDEEEEEQEGEDIIMTGEEAEEAEVRQAGRFANDFRTRSKPKGTNRKTKSSNSNQNQRKSKKLSLRN